VSKNSASGDPGYAATARMLSEAAMTFDVKESREGVKGPV
jgi:hypothetical protein